MGFADLLERTGGMGRFQITQVMLLCLPILLMASHNLLQNFSAAIPSHWCKINDTGMLNNSMEGWESLFGPLDEKGRPESCLEFVEIQWRPVGSNMTSYNSTGTDTRSCTMGWEYDREEFTSTIITEVSLYVIYTMNKLCNSNARNHGSTSLVGLGKSIYPTSCVEKRK